MQEVAVQRRALSPQGTIHQVHLCPGEYELKKHVCLNQHSGGTLNSLAG